MTERSCLLEGPASLAIAATAGLPSEQRWVAARHLLHLSDLLADAVLAGGGRVIVTMPPRHGKSWLVSKWLPIWFLELWPHRSVILGSYAAGYASEWGRRVRNTIEANEGGYLTVKVAQDSSAAHRWNTTEGGGMVTAGVGVGIVGRGADLLICDDAAAKDRPQASSPTWRETVWEWWTGSARTRLEPGATIVHVQTRWHEDDLVGRLLRADEDSGRWRLVNFPAIAEEDGDALGRRPGEALWPERWPLSALEALREGPDAVTSMEWSAQYQQRPAPEGGELFRREHFRYFREEGDSWLLLGPDGHEVRRWPKGRCRIAQTCDTAITEKRTSDWTAVVTFITTPERELLILDSTRARLSVPEQLPFLRRLRDRWKPDWQGVEDKGGGTAVLQYAARDGYPLRPLKPGSADKRTRAFDAIAMYENGRVYHLQGAPWLATFEGELLMFDRADHDDQVDALAYAAAGLRAPVQQVIVI